MKTVDELNKDFGAFYPTGHLVVGFQAPEDARKVTNELKLFGGRFDDIMELSSQEMQEFTEKNLREAGIMASLGTSLATVRAFCTAARKGAMFLIIPTPDEAAAARASTAIHRVPYLLAERYHRLGIETMS